jgi:O-methyltransferase
MSRSIPLNAIVDLMPQPIQEWLTQRRVKQYVATYESLYQMVPVESLKQKQRQALTYLSERLAGDPLGDYLEFGVYNGTSLSCMYQVLQEMGLHQVRLFGFDSFEGMPATASIEDDGTWEPGQFKCGEDFVRGVLTHKGVDLKRVTLTKGWYSNTLTPDLLQRYQIHSASVIMVDCDLYSSTQEVLKFCGPLIRQQPTVIFFDDWNSGDLAAKNLGEKRAFDEFLSVNPQFAVEEFGGYNEFSTGFILTRH